MGPLKHKILLFCILFSYAITIQAAIPSGYYYLAKNKSKAELKTTLAQISAPLKVLAYGSGPGFTWEGFYYTDRNADSTVVDMYSPIVRMSNGFGSVEGMHIEHSLPKSWWGAHENNAYKDLFHLYPSDGPTNSTKNNFPLGEVAGTPLLDNGVSKVGKNGFGVDYFDSCFEPADEFKGDFARSYFYISTIYENLSLLWNSPMMSNNTYPVWKPWAKDLLLKWHRQDPVSQKETDRIEAVYTIQGNRNPFIDYPELAEYIWGADTTKIFPFPEETEPFLLYPRRGENLDFGVIMATATRTRELHLKAVNLTTDISVALKRNSPGFSLPKTVFTSSEVLSGVNVQIVFTPQTSGYLNDTLVISGGGLVRNLQIPLKALASADFITLEPTDITPVGAKLQWIFDPEATSYDLKIYQGDQKAGDLIISAYVEGSSWNKAIEIFNGTGKTVDLSNYSLRKQSNGAGKFGSTFKLNGTLANNSSYLIVHKSATNTYLLANGKLFSDTILQVNGNDAIELVRNGVSIDMVGEADGGADYYWGLDLSLQRKNTVTHPITKFKTAQWNVLPIDSVEFLNTHSMAFLTSEPQIIVQKTVPAENSYQVDGLFPGSIYTYSVKSTRPSGDIEAVNTMQIHTSPLEKPVIMNALNITSSGFTANWEEDLYSNEFLLDVFKTTGSADTTEIEGFGNLGTSGTPLPEGWSGKISGNYNTAASSGTEMPSAGLKNDNDWLQTKTYPTPVSKLTFMYRFPSAAANSYFLLDALSESNWIRVDSIAYKGTTGKAYPVYNFNQSENKKAFRITYKKAARNLAIDDVEVTYGSQDTTFIFRNEPVTGNSYNVTGLEDKELYFYRIQTTLGNARSPYSDIMNVNTLVSTSTRTASETTFNFVRTNDKIRISGLTPKDRVSVYSLTGSCMGQIKATSSEVEFHFPKKGMYIISVQNDATSIVEKFIF